ncbi:MAG: SDR family oxidoreductase [Ktedonobacteraceae bacterium]|nr:SDR family oxidoreductase [Ktedonobacteraceae bacterium]
MSRLEGKIALVTGGGRGIGRTTALALAREGCDVVVVARTYAEIEQVAAEIRVQGRRGLAFACDIADGQAIARTFASLVEETDPVDILINNAGVVEPLGPTATADPELWSQALQVNLIGAFRWIHACLPEMLRRGWGRIVNISTGAAAGAGMLNASAYSTSKAGLEMLTLNLAAELAGSGITVNAVRPGTVDTAMQTHIRSQPAERVGRQMHERFTGLHEQGMLLDPVQPARLITALVLGKSSGEVVSIYDQRGQELLESQP